MENASKALVIAGAILISILIIAIGMYIYNSSTDSIQEGIGSMTTQQKEAFNANWTNYEGKQTGAQVKALINKLISNANTYQEEAGKVVGIYCNASTPSQYSNQMPPAGAAYASVIYDTDSINDEDDNGILDEYVTAMNGLYSNVQARHIYFVDLHINDVTSLIDYIVIHYDEDAP